MLEPDCSMQGLVNLAGKPCQWTPDPLCEFGAYPKGDGLRISRYGDR